MDKAAGQFAIAFTRRVFPDLLVLLQEVMQLSGVKTYAQVTYLALRAYRDSLVRQKADRRA